MFQGCQNWSWISQGVLGSRGNTRHIFRPARRTDLPTKYWMLYGVMFNALAGLAAGGVSLYALSRFYIRFAFSPPSIPTSCQSTGVHFLTRNGTTEKSTTTSKDDELFNDLCECMAASFAGTKDKDPEMFMDWALGLRLANRTVHVELRKCWIKYMMKFCALTAIHKGNGGVLYCRTKDGTIGAASVIRVEDGQNQNWFQTIMDGILKSSIIFPMLGLPPWMVEGEINKSPGFNKRLDVGSGMLKEFHHKWAPGRHVYIHIQATHPDYQGHGFCSKIMNITVAIAEELGIDNYLETGGERNQTVYRRYGFEIMEEREVGVGGGGGGRNGGREQQEEGPNLTYSAMLKQGDGGKRHKL